MINKFNVDERIRERVVEEFGSGIGKEISSSGKFVILGRYEF